VNEKIAGQIEAVNSYLLTRNPDGFDRRVAIRKFLQCICARHIELGLGDSNLVKELCSGDDARYWPRLSEILLANEMLEVGLPLTPSRDGPDFHMEIDGRSIWIEVICPQPTGIPQDWLVPPAQGRNVDYPHQAILLRWTAAIKEKAQKLLGDSATGAKGYIDKAVVGPKDAYVIAVNGRLLRGSGFASIIGISQFPYAVEAGFAVGPMTITIDLDSNKAVGAGHQHRPVIRKPNGAAVPAYSFLDPAFASVSAIWATDIDESWVIGNMKPLAVVHNPLAANKLPTGLLPAQDEYIATANGPDEYVLERRDGRLI